MTIKQFVVAAVDGIMGVVEFIGKSLSDLLQNYHCKNACDWTSFGTIITASVGVITLPNIAQFCSALWLFGRVLEMITGKPVHILIRDARTRFKKWTSDWYL